MKRARQALCCIMRRWTLTILSGLSLLLCVGFVILWFSSAGATRYCRQWSDTSYEETLYEIGVSGRGIGIGYDSWRTTRPDVVQGRTAHLMLAFPDANEHSGFSARIVAAGKDDRYISFGDLLTEETLWTRCGFQMTGKSLNMPGHVSKSAGIAAPLWPLVLLTAILPAYQFFRRERRFFRLRHNRCASCGYDLRASGERCPECGTAIAGGASGLT